MNITYTRQTTVDVTGIPAELAKACTENRLRLVVVARYDERLNQYDCWLKAVYPPAVSFFKREALATALRKGVALPDLDVCFNVPIATMENSEDVSGIMPLYVTAVTEEFPDLDITWEFGDSYDASYYTAYPDA